MKNRITHIGILVLILLACVACGDFLEERSQNMAYVENVSDLDELLIGEAYLSGGLTMDSIDADLISNWASILSVSSVNRVYFPYIHILDDDSEEYVSGGYMGTAEKNYLRMKGERLHTWQADPFYDSEMLEIKDLNWSDYYKRIAALNSIIFQVGELRGGEDDKDLCNRVEGEAYFLRAQCYFWLANLYARPYCKATADTDPCIPLKTSEVVEDRYFARDPMADVYGQMVEDLQHAITSLRGIPQTTKYRTNQAAAFALLSRVYLYMEEYEQAIACADSVLKKDYKLLDLNDYKRGNSAVYVNSPETIFTHGPNIMAIIHAPAIRYTSAIYRTSTFTSSSDLMECFDATDLRRTAFFIQRASPAEGYRCVKMRFDIDEVSDIMAIRLPEVYLNKAEAQALAGMDDQARITIQELRAKRFRAADLNPVTESGEALVNFIRDERRRELCYEGHRWFDLRRYAVNSVYPFTKSIEHVSLEVVNNTQITVRGKYVLKPYPEDIAAYMLPIPSSAIDFNNGMLVNEVRNNREIINE